MRHGGTSSRFASIRVAAMAATCACVLGACGRGDAASAPPANVKPAASSLASVHADAPGIAWFDGDVERGVCFGQGV